MPLSPKARRAAAELETAIADGNTQRVLGLVQSYGLSCGDRVAVVGELDRRGHIPDPDEVTLRFSRFEQAHVHGLADVWRTDRA